MMVGLKCQKSGSNMGYYTSYDIVLKGSDEDKKNFEKALRDISDNNTDVDELLSSSAVYAKLYDIDAWITKVARDFPNLLVILSGAGEEQDDLWQIRWRGSVWERHEAKIPPFDSPLRFDGETD